MSIADRVAVFTGGYFDSDTLTFTDVYTAGWFHVNIQAVPKLIYPGNGTTVTNQPIVFAWSA